MILTGHQPTYLSWLGLFNKISKSDYFVLFDTVQYLPKEWMNRNRLKSPNGPFFITVPVLNKSYLNKKIFEIKINNNIDWKRKHLKSIKLNYSSTEYFNQYFGYFEEIYSKKWLYLSDLNFEILKLLLKLLNINLNLLKLSELDIQGKKSELILNLCKKLGANKFIFGEQGINYAKINTFKENKIDVVFQNYKHPVYKQIYGSFISHLSVLDLLFNCGNKSLKIINREQKL